MTQSMPYDSAAGRLFYWSRQGISLKAVQDLVDQALANGGGGGGTIDPQQLLELKALITSAQSSASAAQATADGANGTATAAQAAAAGALNQVASLARLLGKTVPGTSYTMVTGDDLFELRFTAAGAITAAIPNDTTVNFPVGTMQPYAQKGVGVLTWVGEAGVTLLSPDSTTSRRQQSSGFWIKEAANTWRLQGDVVGVTRPSPIATGIRIPGGSGVTTGSVSVTPPAGNNRMLLICIHTAHTNQVTAVTCTFGGVPATFLASSDSWAASPAAPQRRVDVYYVLNPATTAATLAVTLNVASVLDVTATTFQDVNQSAPFGTPVTFSSLTAEDAVVTPLDVNWNDIGFGAFTGRTNVLPTVASDAAVQFSTIKATDMTVMEVIKQGASIATMTVTQPNQTDNKSAMVGFAIKGA